MLYSFLSIQDNDFQISSRGFNLPHKLLEYVIDHRSCIHLLVVKFKPEKIQARTGFEPMFAGLNLYKGGKFLKKLWCCVGGSITR